ncbi:MAG: sulfotransferase [Limibacillus sp.]
MREILLKAVGLHQRGQVAQAEQLYRQVLAAAPRQPDALRLCGIACSQQGKNEEALKLLEKAAALQPLSAEVNNALGKVLNDLRRHEEAVAKLKLAIKTNPKMAEAHSNLGNALFASGDTNEALTCYRKAVELNPKNVEFLNNLGGALAHSGEHREALEALGKALKVNPGHARALRNLANSCRYLQRNDELKRAYDKALTASKWAPEILLDYATALINATLMEDALELLEEALKRKPDWPAAQLLFSEALLETNRPAEAEALLEKAADGLADDRKTLSRVGRLFQRLGRFDDAEAWLLRALERDPDDMRALDNLAIIGKVEEGSVLFQKALARAAEESRRPLERSHAAFAAAMTLDRVGKHAEAFDYFTLGCDLTEVPEIDWERRLSQVTRCEEVFRPALFERLQEGRSDDPTPIFVVGMPRSGTTLTEQLLSRHPQVSGAGELTAVPASLRELGMNEDGSNFPDFIEGLSPDDVSRAAEAYLGRARKAGGEDARHIVDKLPFNAFFVGWIHLLFPKARIIHCVRDPLDVGVSCFKANFSSITWSFRLEDIAEQYRCHEAAMAVWRRLFPGLVFDLRYEDLVTDPDRVVPSLVEATGLPWDDACLDEKQRATAQVKTASLWQVRQPISAKSVGSWRRYEQGLEPLRRRLSDFGLLREEES